MQIDLSQSDVRLLKSVLDLRLSQVRDELAHTDDREYRASLRADTEKLEELDGRLAALLASSG
ncbi:MAG: hypothetical protein HUU21_02145 [Polyangiaceae bacterium]|nr:hypothetical protein [Polyangiaceae bacterium]